MSVLPESQVRLDSVAVVNKTSINPKKEYDWINYTDISSVGPHTVGAPTRFEVAQAPGRARRVMTPGDIVLSTVRPNRRSFFKFTAQWDRAICSTGFAVVSANESSDSDYLYAYLTSKEATLHYQSICEGGAYPAFNGALLNEMNIPWPTGEIRQIIGGVSQLLREKILVNEQLAERLEEIVQAIFKSWFVDFDPVHAKARGEQPEGMDAETADLFPGSFEDSEIGPIPAGFSLATFASFAEVLLGGTPSKTKPEYWDGTIPWINSGAINGFRIMEATRNITELGLRKSSCKLMPKGTTVLAITGATLGQFSRVEIETTANQSVIGICPFENHFNDYVYLWVSRNIGQLTSKATGGAQQHINRNDVCEQLVLLPSTEIATKFSELVSPMFESISNLMFENQSLSQLRDLLLPRLISGELQIPEELLGD